jgi:RHS repeat-associated protein
VERAGLAPAAFTLDALGRVVQAATGDVVQSWSYERGTLVEHTVTTPDGGTTTRIDRDEDDRITAITGPDGRVTYRHDAAAQLVSALDDDGAGRTWRYDAAGRLVAETVDGAERRHEYDAAGQLVATTGPDGARTVYVHDGLGRRVRRTAPDGSTTEYAWSGLGSLAGIVERDAAYAETGRIEVWTDALGEVAEVGGVDTWWDTAAGVPSLTAVGGVPVLEAPGGVVAVDGSWAAAGWRGARATDAADPWALLASMDALGGAAGLPAGVGVTAGGSLSIGGMEWLGARVYDPVAKGFLSTDPLAPVVGAAWAGNPYSYAGNDPLHAVDPLGLRPATDKDLQAYRDAHQGVLGGAKQFLDDHADMIGKIAVAAGVALAVASLFTPVGPLTVLAMVGAGATMSGGLSILQQKSEDGKVDWGKVGVDTAIGGVTGLVGGGAANLLAKAAPAVEAFAAPAVSRLGSPLLRQAATSVIGESGRSALAAGAQGATSNGLSYLADDDKHHKSVDEFLDTTADGFKLGMVASGASSTLAPLAARTPGLSALPGMGKALSTSTDHLLNGASSVVNEMTKPADPGDTPSVQHLKNTFLGGVMQGASGPDR